MLSTDQDRKLYDRMRREAERLATLRRWLNNRGDESLRTAIDSQLAATIHTCDILARGMNYGETKRHRIWITQCWWGG